MLDLFHKQTNERSERLPISRYRAPLQSVPISSLRLLTRMPHYRSTAFYRKKKTDRRCTKCDSFSASLGRKLATTETTLHHARDTTIEHLEAHRRWLAGHEQEEKEEKGHLSKECAEEKVSGKYCRLHFPQFHLMRRHLLCR